MKKKQTDIIFDRITCNENREMTKTRFHQAINEAENEILILAKAMTEHLNQNDRNEWFDVKLEQRTITSRYAIKYYEKK